MRVKVIALMAVLFSVAISFGQDLSIIPSPQEVKIGKDSFQFNNETAIVSNSSSENVAVLLQDFLKKGLDGTFPINDSGSKNAVSFQWEEELSKEAYKLEISKKRITIKASSETGLFYGLQSLKQLFPTDFGTSETKLENISLTSLEINDWPRFGWRAFMLDESRHFKGKDQVKMLLDEMAYLKMNVFHWHLVDDQGWRIEIKKYPLLTEVGSKRKSTQIGPRKWKSPIQSAELHEGFYTQEEIKEIVKYAQERHITIMPEIEMPGHSSAAIAAYPWLGTHKKEIEVPIKFGKGPDVYDVTDSRVYEFLTDVIDEVITLFPSKVIHIGGDEVEYKHWKSSKAVQDYMKQKGLKTPAELQIYFTNGISQYIQGKGKRMMGWNEVLGHNVHDFQDEADTETDQELAKETIVHFWKGDVDLATEAAKNGYDIVNSLHSNTYLDYNYKSIPLAKAYAFDPIPKGLEEKYHSKVIGTGCQMWGEWIPTNGKMHFMVFPRIAAYAEVGWTELENKDYKNFKESLKDFQKRWERKEIYFAPDSETGE